MKRRNFLKSQHVRQYKAERYKNPYNRNRKQFKGLKKVLIVLGVIVGIAAIPVLFFQLDLLRIHNVEIDGLASISNEEVTAVVQTHLDGKRFGILPQNHRFFFNKKQLRHDLQNEFFFEELAIETGKQQTLHIWAKERVTSLVWLTGDQAYFLDLEGVITRELTEAEKNPIRERIGVAQVELPEGEVNASLLPTMPIIEDASDSGIALRQRIFNSENTESIITFDQGVRSQILEPFLYVIDDPSVSWMTLHTKNGFYLQFDPTLDVQDQLSMLQVVLLEYNDKLDELNYIDLRFGNHVFVK